MSETQEVGVVFRSDLFSEQPTEDVGEAGLVPIDAFGVDVEMRHPTWDTVLAARIAGQQLLGEHERTSWGLASHGYLVYEDLLDEPAPMEAVYLDSRCFPDDVDLIDVLEEAAKWAIDYDDKSLVAPLVRGMIHTAQMGNFAGDVMQKYHDTVMSSADYKAISEYVGFMNANTLKTRPESKTFLMRMVRTLQAMPEKVHLDDYGISHIEKKVLLESIGQAWLRKGWPIAEVDWLP